MSSESEEYYTDEPSSVINESASGRSSVSKEAEESGSDVTIDDSDNDSNENSGVRRSKKNRRSNAVVISDSEEEDELDQRALSPHTRMSITGIRPQDIDDDSSEIDYSDEEHPKTTDDDNNMPRYSTQFAGSIENSLHSTQFPIPHDDTESPIIIGKSKVRRRVALIDSDSEEEDKVDQRVLSPQTHRSITGIRTHDTNNDSSMIDHSDQEQTKITNNTREPVSPSKSSPGNEESVVNESKNSSGSDVMILSNNEVTIEISSGSDENDTDAENRRPSNILPLPKRRKSIIDLSSNENEMETKNDLYTKSQKLVELNRALKETEELYVRVADKLPDQGAEIKKRINGLRREISMQTNLLVAGNKVSQDKPQPPKISSKTVDKQLDWDQLSAAVNEIQPKYTGAQGMATFNNQKTLTMDSLKDLHGSLKGCPAEDVLADNPTGLKVELMDHQRHALAWMAWREQQRPRGGILADDMGLGKTLTMISLVLGCKNQQKSDDGNNDDSSDGEDAENEKNAGGWNSKGRKETYKGGTLVVCPASLLGQWKAEVDSKVSRHKLTVCLHHGPNRETRGKHLRTYDIVVSTYNIVSREHKQMGALFGVRWRRIILDEAHVIRNHKGQSSIAVSELRGKYRWALTGTPIQNKELDIYALLKFLRCSPFDDLATWKRWIDNKSAGGQERLNLLVKSIMLRRTKAQLQLNGKLNSLPSKEIRLVEIKLDTEEMNVYQKVMSYSRTLFAQFLFQRAEKDSDSHFINDAQKPTYNQIQDPNGAYYKMHEKFTRMAGHNTQVKSHEILVLLLRLRQICCHPGLIDAMLEEECPDSLDHNESEEYTPEIDLLAQLNKLTIGEEEREEGTEDTRFAKASKNVLKRSNPVYDLSRPSSKMIKTLEIVKTSVLPADDKAIIVSQWKSVLDIVGEMLAKEGIKTLSLNGKIPVPNRQAIVDEFNDPRGRKRILLLSLTAGGVGLNLIGANHLILLDLHWNPQLEAQAQDRIFRVGQKKDVIIYKIICMDTVEQRIKGLQDHKLGLADGLLTGKVSTKLSIDDLKSLFSM